MAYYAGDLPGHEYFGDQVARHLLTSTSAHEASHALVGRFGGIELGEMEVLLHNQPDDIGSSGSVQFEFGPERLPAVLIAAAAGQVGQSMWYARYKPGYSFDRAMVEVAPGACHDMELFRRLGGRKPPVTLPDAQMRARQILEPRWREVEQLAMMLFAKRRAHGSKVRTELRRGETPIELVAPPGSKPMSGEDQAKLAAHTKATGCPAHSGRDGRCECGAKVL